MFNPSYNRILKSNFMKNGFLLFVFTLLVCFSASAQSTLYKPFKVDAGLLLAFPTTNDYELGVGIYVEPKYNVTDQFAMGFKGEFVGLASNTLLELDGDLVEVNVSGVASFLLTADYYLTNTIARPFVGIGAGAYILGDVDYADDEIYSVNLGTRLGFAPRVGVVLGHFRVALEYNVIPSKEDLESRSYLGMKVGFEIGGGKRSAPIEPVE